MENRFFTKNLFFLYLVRMKATFIFGGLSLAFLPLHAQQTDWSSITTTQIPLDMKYATADNFLKEAVYPCAECWLRSETAAAVLKAQAYFLEKGYSLHIWDCYRPRRIQYKMWEIVNNPSYVADPRKGSIHNRGGAVDLTLATLDGELLDMGTDFDYFGPESHREYAQLTPEQKTNRALLQAGMEAAGFVGLPSEWWHYDLQGSKEFPLADFQWECKD